MINEMMKIIDSLDIIIWIWKIWIWIWKKKPKNFIIFRKRMGNIHIDNDLVVDNEKSVCRTIPSFWE